MTSHLFNTTIAPSKMLGDGSPQELLATFSTYGAAEQLVDQLSDGGFPVTRSRIVGTDLRSVEIVTGRLTPGRAASAGAASGAWLGLLVGLLLGLFSDSSQWFGTLIGSALIGAVWMAAFGYLAQRATHGRRDFASVSRLEADHYAVYVDRAHAAQARQLTGHR